MSLHHITVSASIHQTNGRKRMETVENYHPVTTTRIRLERMGSGQLKVHQTFKDGVLLHETFTLESLAHVLDIPMSTMDGRYNRAKLSKWNTPIQNGYGRPARGFPYVLLQDVINIINTKGAVVAHDANGSGPSTKRVRQVQDLRPEYYEGGQYFTVPALSEAFGYSETTIRKKLQRAGLMSKFRDLHVSLYGGRPKRGIPQRYLGDVQLALEGGGSSVADVSRVLTQAGGYSAARAAAKQEMIERIVDHEPPVPNSLRAWNRDTMAPAKPVNAVNYDAVTDDLADQIERELAAIHIPGVTDKPEHKTTQPRDAGITASVPPQPDEDDPAAIQASMTRMHREALIQADEEPTQEELRDTVEMLSLDKAAADRFIADVRMARSQRGNA
jgi:hypothetical protein